MEYKPVPPSHYAEVIVHLRNNFFFDEPLNNSVGLLNRRGEPHAELESYCMDTLKDKISVMAFDTGAGQVAGIALNGIIHKEDISKAQEKLRNTNDEKFKQILMFLHSFHNETDFFSKYKVDDICECRIISVDERYRGAGVAKQLVLRSELLAEEQGCKIMKTDATSYYSQKLFKEMGFSTVQEGLYSDYTDNNGRPIFATKPPHKSYKVLIKELSLPSNKH